MTLRQIVSLFVGMGCVPQEFPGQDVIGGDKWDVYYLRSPDGFGIIDLTIYDMDERIAPSVLESWERVMGVNIPRTTH